MNPVDEILLFSSKSRIKVLNILMNEISWAWWCRTRSGFSLEAFLNRKSGRELDLSLCAFNYTRLAGLQSPESWGKAHVRTSHSDGSSVLPYLNTLEGGREGGRNGESERLEDRRHHWGQYRVNAADTFTRATGGCRSFLSILTDTQWKQLSRKIQVTSKSQPANSHIEYSIKPHI